MPGLLDRFKQIQQPRQKTGKSLLDLAIDNMATNAGKVFPTTEEMNANLRNVLSPEVANSMLGIGELNKEAAKAYEDKMKNIALAALTVYHGSPHKFDKFDMSKIGTGEGAQAYGRGLYFAESPEVADEYAGKLSKAIIQFKNKTPQDEYEKRILEILQKNADVMQYDSRGSAVRQSYRNFLEPKLWKFDPKNPKANPYNKTVPLEGEELSNAIKYKEAAQRLGDPSVFDSGNFYKVDIPDESIPRMLDWDAPLSKQAPEVRKALQQAAELRAKQTGGAFGPLDMNQFGRDVVPTLGEGRLRQAGIPGIRYLDGMSRNAGQGSYNYVLFDDQLPRILEINGVPTGNQPWMPGEFQGLLGR